MLGDIPGNTLRWINPRAGVYLKFMLARQQAVPTMMFAAIACTAARDPADSAMYVMRTLAAGSVERLTLA